MYQVDEKKYPIEMRFKAAVKTYNKYLAAILVQVNEKFGDEGIEMIGKVYADMADEIFLDSFRRLGFAGDGPKELGEWFAKANAIVGVDTDVVVISDNKAGFRVNECPWWNDHPNPLAEKICGQGITCFERRATQKLNPKLQFSMPRAFFKGDGVCEFIFERPQE